MERGSGSRRGGRRRAIAIEAELPSAALEIGRTAGQCQREDTMNTEIGPSFVEVASNVNLGAFDRIWIAPLS
jgi:hypothetical protein